MAFSMALVDRICFGNLKMRVYTVTDAQSTGSTFKVDGFDTVWAVRGINNTDSSDTFGEKPGDGTSHLDSQSARNTVILTPVTDNDDGICAIWGR